MIHRFICVIIMIGLSACAAAPGPEQLKQDDTAAKAGQFMRVAETTRAGGDLINALVLYQRAAAVRPDWLDPVMAMGDTAYAANEYAFARDAYQRAATMDGAEFNAVIGLGRFLLRLGEFEEAVVAFDHAPNDARALNGAAVSMDLLGQSTQA